jgi:hypothetical protein
MASIFKNSSYKHVHIFNQSIFELPISTGNTSVNSSQSGQELCGASNI